MSDKEMTYDHLAAGLKEALQNDKSAFDADRLQKYTGKNFILCNRFFDTFILPNYLNHVASRAFFCQCITNAYAKRGLRFNCSQVLFRPV